MNNQSCQKLENTRWRVSSFECCDYPSIVSDELFDACSDKCFNENITTHETCCYDNCIYKDTGLFIDGNFDSIKLVNSFIKDAKEKNFIVDWHPVVEKAFSESLNDCKFQI